ncbi:hypothetical protein V8B97DRAFT_1722405 [Scleroderma yunnanense]
MFPVCVPLVFGCPTKINPEGDQSPRICPRCHNAAMFAAKSRTWFEFCFVPLIPMSSKHVWMCGICQLQTQMQPGQLGTCDCAAGVPTPQRTLWLPAGIYTTVIVHVSICSYYLFLYLSLAVYYSYSYFPPNNMR